MSTPQHQRISERSTRGSFSGYDRGSLHQHANSPTLNTLIKECRDDERVEVVKKLTELLDSEGISIDTLNLNGTTAFITAASFGSLSILQWLHQKGADVNQVKRGSERTALHVAAENGHISVAEWLCDMGININEIDAKGYTALMCAANSGNLGIVRILLEKGADVMAKSWTRSRKTVFHIACSKGHREIAECLIDHSVKMCALYSVVDAKTAKGSTGLFLAAKKGHVPVFKLLVERGYISGINDFHEAEKTPLMAACEGGHTEIVETILAVDNVDINKQSATQKMTALHYAASVDNLQIINMLVAKGANMYLENKQKKKPYHMCMDPKCQQVLKPGYYALAVQSLPTLSVHSLTDMTANLVEAMPAKAVVGSLVSVALVAGLSLLKSRFQ